MGFFREKFKILLDSLNLLMFNGDSRFIRFRFDFILYDFLGFRTVREASLKFLD